MPVKITADGVTLPAELHEIARRVAARRGVGVREAVRLALIEAETQDKDVDTAVDKMKALLRVREIQLRHGARRVSGENADEALGYRDMFPDLYDET